MGAEVRVHGIGDHDYSSALGSPEVDHSTSRIEVASPPVVPPHDLKLVNWSRTSRGLSRGLLWYVVFPFTLVNAASHMGNSRMLRWMAPVVGLLLTIAAATWGIVILESVLKYVPLATNGDPVGRTVAVAVPIAMAVTIVVRKLIRNNPVRWPLVLGHALVLVVFGLLVAVVRPAQRVHSGWLSTVARDPNSGDLVARLDAATLLVVATTVLTVLCAALVQLTARNDPGTAAAAIVLSVAMALMHTGSSLLRMAVDWLAGWASPVGVDHPDVLSYADRTLMAYYSQYRSYAPRLDIIPVFGIAAGLSLLAAGLLIVLLRRSTFEPRPVACPTCPDRPRWTHNLVVNLPTFLLPIGLLAGLLMTAISALLIFNAADLTTGTPWFIASRVINALTVLTAIAVGFRRSFPAVYKVMSAIADISGFWPVAHHPFAGVSYRKATLQGIRNAIDATGASRVVLVGHSQGSVLCAWLVSGRDPEITRPLPAEIDLVTCGSPLDSLYARLFPRFFDAAFFADVVANRVTWRNFWRDTDPIATSLPQIGDENNQQLTDPLPGRQVAGHSDYWIDPDQKAWIEGLINTSQTPAIPQPDTSAQAEPDGNDDNVVANETAVTTPG